MTPAHLRASLDDLDMSRSELARLCGVARETVSRWLRDPDAPGSRAVPTYVETIIKQQRALKSRAA